MASSLQQNPVEAEQQSTKGSTQDGEKQKNGAPGKPGGELGLGKGGTQGRQSMTSRLRPV